MALRHIPELQATVERSRDRFLRCVTIVVVFIIIGGSPATVCADSVDDTGLWWAFFGQGDISDQQDQRDCCRLKWWFDGHTRFLEDADGFNQSIVRPGVGLSTSQHSAIWAGYGWIRTSPLEGADFDEHRFWQQWTWSRSHDPFLFALRSRLEQRFLETGDDTGWRFRQLVRAQYALPHCPCWTFVVWDEIFVHLNDTDWGARDGFNQNRLFVGFGAKRDSRRRTEIGYLNQLINVPGGNDRMNHILSINVYRRP